MNQDQLIFFKEKNKEQLRETDLKLNEWLKLKMNYEELVSRIEDISEKTRHEIMMPIAGTKVAFIPGYIQHTNEFLVLLGENYFVERSAKQSKEIAKRRIELCDTTIEKFKKEKEQYENWLDFTKNIQKEKDDFVEIVEELDEEKEKEWREEHRRKLREYKIKEREERMTKLNEWQDKCDSVFERLEQNEALQSKRRETNEPEDSDQQKNPKQSMECNSKKKLEKQEKRVSFDDEPQIIENPSPSSSKTSAPLLENEAAISVFGDVVERSVSEKLPCASASSTDTSSDADVKVSKFKASRSRNK